MEELENLEETLNESIRESMGARTGNISGGKKKGAVEDEEEFSRYFEIAKFFLWITLLNVSIKWISSFSFHLSFWYHSVLLNWKQLRLVFHFFDDGVFLIKKSISCFNWLNFTYFLNRWLILCPIIEIIIITGKWDTITSTNLVMHEYQYSSRNHYFYIFIYMLTSWGKKH